MTLDRRSGNDRRHDARYSLVVDLEYEDHSGRHGGTMSDVSRSGCFILAKADAADGEGIRVFLPLNGGMSVQFGGSVVNHVPEIGLGIRFDDLSAAQREVLSNFIETRRRQTSADARAGGSRP